MTPCRFCRIVAEQEPATIVRAWTDAIAIVPLAPVTSGHLIVIPHIHVPDALVDPRLTGRVMQRAASLAAPDCNLITSVGTAATQTVRHLHIHIVPRRAGDGLLLPWSVQQGAAEFQQQKGIAIDDDRVSACPLDRALPCEHTPDEMARLRVRNVITIETPWTVPTTTGSDS